MSNIVPIQSTLTQDDFTILANTKFKGFSKAEIDYCAKVIGLLNLSPFLNQVHFTRRVGRDGKPSIVTQIGIDGFRLTAERTKSYAGSDEPIFAYDPKDKDQRYPIKATVIVYKIVQGVRCPFAASARWTEYYPSDAKACFMWDKMPHGQLAKCAEALALRKAFPAELGGIYAEEEMQQAKEVTVFPEQPEEGDGIQTNSYVIPYGPLAKQSIENADPAKLRDYVMEIEEKAKRMNKPIPAWAQELIQHAEPLIAAFENQTGDQEPGWEG